jgi:hypothetical protein
LRYFEGAISVILMRHYHLHDDDPTEKEQKKFKQDARKKLSSHENSF